MIKKSDIGYFQEKQPGGMIANSSTKLLSAIFGGFTLLLLVVLVWRYEINLSHLFALMDKGLISEVTFATVVRDLQIIEPSILIILAFMIFAPKYLHRLALLGFGRFGKLSETTIPEDQEKEEKGSTIKDLTDESQ